MADVVELKIKMTRSAVDLLVSCANIGLEGAEGNLADIDDVADLLDELAEIAESPNDLFVIDQEEADADSIAEARGFELGKQARRRDGIDLISRAD